MYGVRVVIWFTPVVSVLVFAMERTGRAARAAVARADAVKWRRENSLVLGMILLFLWKRL
jgi:hypothetical protein